jgi:tRNA threonylcarbamoyl adenosine modification protein (Sua5/YciO/YrdC/YwlC family)
MIIEIHPKNPQPRLIKQAAQVIRDGNILLFPTDTKYDIGCDLFNKRAVDRLYRITHADKKKLFSVICTDFHELSKYAQISNLAYKVMRRLLPGPYTFILPGTRILPKITMSKRKTIGVRIPDNRILLELGKEYNGPILSAGLPEIREDEPLDLWEVEERLGHEIDMIIDGGPVFPRDSTIIELINDQIELIRQGAGDISWLQQIEAVGE